MTTEEIKRIDMMIEQCFENESKLTEWENQFLIMAEERFDEMGALTDKQIAVLERIYEAKASI